MYDFKQYLHEECQHIYNAMKINGFLSNDQKFCFIGFYLFHNRSNFALHNYNHHQNSCNIGYGMLYHQTFRSDKGNIRERKENTDRLLT